MIIKTKKMTLNFKNSFDFIIILEEKGNFWRLLS